jgi:hypothetical protein
MKEVFDVISTYAQLVDELCVKYSTLYGFEPFNVSMWDPSDEFSQKMLPFLDYKYPQNVINYKYTHQIIDIKDQLLKQFGIDPAKKNAILTPNGTSSIMLAVHWIKMKGYKRLNVLCPSYFSLINNCQMENIEFVKHEMNYKTGQIKGIVAQEHKGEVFWFTNPFYSLGHHITGDSLKLIEELLDENIVIVDDCVAQKGKELSHFFGNHPNFLGMYAPHKSISVNGIKFSILTFNHEYKVFFEQCVDYMCGGLNIASLTAIDHFLDGSYDLYGQVFQETINKTHEWVDNLCAKTRGAYYVNKDQHYLTSIFFPEIPYKSGGNRDFLWDITDKTGTTFIPGILNNYPEESGFSFRINMARDSATFRDKLAKVLLILGK